MIKLPSKELTRVDVEAYRCFKGHQKYFSNIEYEKSLGDNKANLQMETC